MIITDASERLVKRIGVIAVAVLAAGCGSIPMRTPPAGAMALPVATSGKLSQVVGRISADLAPGESAFWLLDRADFSYEARLALVDQAVESLAIQYFIWEKDPTSRLMSDRVIQAADRGVPFKEVKRNKS